LKLTNRNKGLDIKFEDVFLTELSHLSLKKYPNEFGGFLIGYYNNNNKSLVITGSILPKKYKGTPNLFNRSSIGIEEQLKDLYEEAPKKYYVGEWHTHPNGSTQYSNTDLNAMIEISNCKTVRIKNPVLLILGINKAEIIDFSFYIYDDKKLLKYEK
jgi:integrative and conjugative element protein (TIGR02256 family)